jgi:hypothetical protein
MEFLYRWHEGCQHPQRLSRHARCHHEDALHYGNRCSVQLHVAAFHPLHAVVERVLVIHLSSLAIKLCETSGTWRRLVAPVAEHVAQELSSSMSKPSSTSARQRIATRLTQSRKRAVKGSEVPSVRAPKPERVCRGCGDAVQRDATNCSECNLKIAIKRLVQVARAGRVAGHTPEAIAKEAATHRKHGEARRWWKSSNQPAWLTEQLFLEKIQPALAQASATAIAKRIGVSRWYAGRIREGYRPHPRHWQALALLVGFCPGTELPG